MTSLQLAGAGVASFISVCLVLHAARRAYRRRHEQSVLDAIRAMTLALDTESSQQALLREIVVLLSEQEQIALALEARIRGLLPELADSGPDSGAAQHLNAVSELATKLQQTSWLLPDIEARVMRLLRLPDPPMAALSYVADSFDFSRDTLVRAEFIHVRDHTGHVPDSLVLNAALDAYSAEVASDAVQAFTSEAGESADRFDEIRASGSTSRAAVGVFQEGLRHLPQSARGRQRPAIRRPRRGRVRTGRGSASRRVGCASDNAGCIRFQPRQPLVVHGPWVSAGLHIRR
jgi:hypothetical protein